MPMEGMEGCRYAADMLTVLFSSSQKRYKDYHSTWLGSSGHV